MLLFILKYMRTGRLPCRIVFDSLSGHIEDIDVVQAIAVALNKTVRYEQNALPDWKS